MKSVVAFVLIGLSASAEVVCQFASVGADCDPLVNTVYVSEIIVDSDGNCALNGTNHCVDGKLEAGFDLPIHPDIEKACLEQLCDSDPLCR